MLRLPLGREPERRPRRVAVQLPAESLVDEGVDAPGDARAQERGLLRLTLGVHRVEDGAEDRLTTSGAGWPVQPQASA